MKLEFLDDISEGGKFGEVVADQLVRLYDFDYLEAEKFRSAVQQAIIEEKIALDLSGLEFIESINCKLTLRLADTDNGLSTTDKTNFICDLTIGGYEEMLTLLEPFV